MVKGGKRRKMALVRPGGGDEGRNTYAGLCLHLLKKCVSRVMGANREDEGRVLKASFQNMLQQ
jgi:hypothetical protein